MKWNNFALWATALGTSLFFVVATTSDSVPKAAPLTPAATVSSQDFNAIARDIYVYAYPIVSMDLTMRQATNVPNANMINMRAPVNQLAHRAPFRGLMQGCGARECSIAEASPWPPRQSQTSDRRPAERKST